MGVTALDITRSARDPRSGWSGAIERMPQTTAVSVSFGVGYGIPWIIDAVSFGVGYGARDIQAKWNETAGRAPVTTAVSVSFGVGYGIPWIIDAVSFGVGYGARDIQAKWNETAGRAPVTDARPVSFLDVGYGISLGRIRGRVTWGRSGVPMKTEVFALADGTLQVEGVAISDAETGEFEIGGVMQGRSYTLLYRHPTNDTNDGVLRGVVAGPPS